MVKKTEIGEPIPKGVIDTATGSVGVEEQQPMSPAKQIKQLRIEVDNLRRRLSDAGYDVEKPAVSSVSVWPTVLFGCATAMAAFALLWVWQQGRRPASRYSLFADAILTEISRRLPGRSNRSSEGGVLRNNSRASWF